VPELKRDSSSEWVERKITIKVRACLFYSSFSISTGLGDLSSKKQAVEEKNLFGSLYFCWQVAEARISMHNYFKQKPKKEKAKNPLVTRVVTNNFATTSSDASSCEEEPARKPSKKRKPNTSWASAKDEKR
jgi:hypothetical protein